MKIKSLYAVTFGAFVNEAQILPSVCGNFPLSAQCSATVPQVYSYFGSLCILNWYINIFLLLRHNYGKASRRVERIETYTIGVQCEALTVENVNGKKHVDIFRLMILKSVYNKYGVCILLRCLGIMYNSSLFYTIQICKLRQNWQCQEWLF